MDDKKEKQSDAVPIRPVSSLLSHFEGLKVNHLQPDERGTGPSSPQPLRPVDVPSPGPAPRKSFDLVRPVSPWAGVGSASHVGSYTPAKGSESPTRSHHKRPMSMLMQSSPQLTPSVKVDSPRSPPRTYFERSVSRSPERFDDTPFAKVRELISQHSSRPPTRPTTPRAPSQERAGTSVAGNEQKSTDTQAPRSPGRPPPINRAEKPKIPAKPMTIAPPPGNAGGIALRPEAPRRPSFEARISPFSTPPSSNESSPTQSPEPVAPMLGFTPTDPTSAPSRIGGQPISAALSDRGKDSRLLGFASKAPTTERKDPRTIGFAPPEPQPPSRQSTLPSRANTVSEKPSRDPRELGFVSGKPSPRHVSETIRSTPPPPVVHSQSIRAPHARDPRQLGFNSQQQADVGVIEEEARPDLPPRRNIEPPPRPSNESKNQIKPVTQMQHHGVPDKARKLIPAQPVSRTPAVAVDTRFPPPPKRGSVDSVQVPTSANSRTEVSNRSSISAAAPRASRDDSDDAEERAEEPSTLRSEYPDATNTNRRPPFCKDSPWEIGTRSDSRTLTVCGKYLCTAGYVTRVFDMTSGEQVMSINHGETVKVTAVAFKPAADLAQEGAMLWLGTNAGELMELEVATYTIKTTNLTHNRREIVSILRNGRDLWTLDDDGKLFVWEADETGVPSLKYSHISHKVQRGHSFSMVIDGTLWLATGKEVRVYKPGNENSFAALTGPLSQHGTGDVTCGTHSKENGGRAYFGHNDGRVTIYSTQNFSFIGNIKASDYKINSMSYVGDRLWAAFKTGMVYVYDTSTLPWKVKKDWRAHEGPATELLLDPSSVWTLQRLQVVTIGHDNYVRLWDAALEDDWIESEMHSRDVEYCTFRKVRAAVITWNVGASTPYDVRKDFIADAIHAEDPPEILAFGFQEVVDLEDRAVTAKSILGFGKKKDTVKNEQHQSRVYREWRDYLSLVINRNTSADYSYSELQTSSLIGLFQCVFIRQEERQHVRNLQATSVKLGLKGRYGNKGALVTRFVLDDSSVCFVNCHLAAGQTHTSHRNNDVASILEAESLDAEPDLDNRSSLYVGGGDGAQVLDHEICILNGDLNYRIDTVPRDTVVQMIKRNELAKLLERDQIMVSRRRVAGFRLALFNELPITFAPTYKYDVGTDNYDTSEKKRAPAWCDRVLYRGPGRVKQLEYRRHEVQTSDHRPVSGIFKLRIKTIDTRKRTKVKDTCYEQFAEVRRRIAEKASTEYLVTTLGVGEQEARRLITGK
ncbi:phosphatidylinositol-bisphosphatase [Exophiala viscosa]|uniref:Phosphatidylinositol-bisphosphatase n=1 Tax=Exophiala viscosa TaxID=2486360 RepID=A0AAN6E071_9EURO|nr:phosphatidylinositol-bisphosphatase [Exophiala viscosa]